MSEKDINTSILNKLNSLEQKIHEEDITLLSQDTKEWEGADVVICSKLTHSLERWVRENNIVIGFQNTQPERRLVVTKFSKELSWLFCNLKDIFQSKFDCESKYDFYGILAQTALNFINTEKENMKGLLISVLLQAKKFI